MTHLECFTRLNKGTLVSKLQNLFRSLFNSPILWGLLGAASFYILVFSSPLGTELVRRYFTRHPVEYGETILFAVGMAALLLRAMEVAEQRAVLRKPPLGPVPPIAPLADEACRAIEERLGQLPSWRREDYYFRRVRAAVNFVRQRGSAQGLGDELKYMADLDAGRLQNVYALFHVIIWAIPILGFLGTTIGITMALNGVDLKDFDGSMVHVLTGLGLKFDTTTVGLAMAILLMFSYFFVHRSESGLLEQVDLCAARDLGSRFPETSVETSGDAAAVRRLAEVMVQSVEKLVFRQAELWQASMDAAAGRWSRMAEAAGDQLEKAMSGALAENLRMHAEHLAAAEQTTAEQNRRQWEKVYQAQTENVKALASLQGELAGQADVLARAVEASGEVARLQDALNRNLAALAGAKHFEKTVEGLAATIHLLNARLSESPAEAISIQLEPARHHAKAA